MIVNVCLIFDVEKKMNHKKEFYKDYANADYEVINREMLSIVL